jgi:hypothetical protein
MADERKLILERLKTEAKVVGTTTTDFFSSNVPESKMRYVVSIFIMGDGVASRVVDIYKKEEDGTYTPKFPMIPVAPADVKQLPQSGYDVVLEGGTNLAGKVDAGAGVSLAVIYWDDER